MTYYAKINNGKVVNVIVADADFIATYDDGAPGQWVETWLDGSLRKNYAGIGHTYDAVRDAFIPPPLYPSWVLAEESCLWEAPIPKPPGECVWDEAANAWLPHTPAVGG